MCYYKTRGDNMKKRITFTFDESTIDRLKKVSGESMIPQARIVEKAILTELEKMESTKK